MPSKKASLLIHAYGEYRIAVENSPHYEETEGPSPSTLLYSYIESLEERVRAFEQAATEVLENWESGNLAEAVNYLAELME